MGVLRELGAPVAAAVPLRTLLRGFWPDVRPFVLALGAAVGASVLSPVFETAGIWAFKRIVDEVLVPHDLAPLPGLALLLAGLVLGDAAAGVADRYLSAWTCESFLVSLRTRVLRHLLRLPLSTLESRPAGDLISRLEADSGAIGGFLVAGLGGALANVFRLLFFAGALLWLDLPLAAVALCAVPAFALTVRRFSRRIREAAREERRRIGGASAVAQEGLTAAALVQSFGREDAVCERFAVEARSAMRAHLAGTRLRALLSPLLDIVDLAGGLGVVALGTWALARGHLSLGGLLAFITYLGKLYGPARALGCVAGQAWSAAAAGERIQELLLEAPAPPDAPQRVRRHPPPSIRGAITFENVCFRYPGSTVEALRGVSFHLEPGSVLAVIGPSGAGKSTIARLVLRLYEPTGGRILLDGEDVRGLPVEVVRAAVSLVPQETVLFHASVRENIAFGRPDATEVDLRRAAREASADGFVRRLPAGYETVLGERGMRLSGGQRQRIALARALVREAPVLLLDEPAAGLDAASARRVLHAAVRAAPSRATLLITHDLGAIDAVSEVLVLDAGQVVQRGSHRDLSRREGVFASLHGSASREEEAL